VRPVAVVVRNVNDETRTWGGVIVELSDIEISEFTRRSRSFLLAHGASGLLRGLEYGERVLLHTGDEYRTAVVADIDHDSDDAYYRLVLGGRVPAEIALVRSRTGSPSLSGRVSVHDVTEVLAHAKAGHRIPAQRRPAESLLDR
jgi:hypothetical protein